MYKKSGNEKVLNNKATMLSKLFVALIIIAQTWAIPNPRIIGGSPAPEGQFPSLVSLRRPGNYHYCGGAIVSENFVVSAAHCLQGENIAEISIYAGSVYIDHNVTFRRISWAKIHPDFGYENVFNDISVIKLSEPLTFNANIQPLKLPIGLQLNAGDLATATGWGDISYPIDQLPNQLQYLERPIVETDECSQALNTTIKPSQICFEGDKGHGLCFGDSGSPLIYNSNNQSYIIGVVSWGEPCAVGYPDVFTRVSYFNEWVQEQINSDT